MRMMTTMTILSSQPGIPPYLLFPFFKINVGHNKTHDSHLMTFLWKSRLITSVSVRSHACGIATLGSSLQLWLHWQVCGPLVCAARGLSCLKTVSNCPHVCGLPNRLRLEDGPVCGQPESLRFLLTEKLSCCFFFFYHLNSFPRIWSLVPHSLDSLAEWDKKNSGVRRGASNIVHSTCCSLKTSCFECNVITEWDPGDCSKASSGLWRKDGNCIPPTGPKSTQNKQNPNPTNSMRGTGMCPITQDPVYHWKWHSGAHEAAVMRP